MDLMIILSASNEPGLRARVVVPTLMAEGVLIPFGIAHHQTLDGARPGQ